MKARCYNSNDSYWYNYGGDDVGVYEPWINDFSAFLAAVGPKLSPAHSLSRKNDTGNYEPGNVLWEIQCWPGGTIRWADGPNGAKTVLLPEEEWIYPYSRNVGPGGSPYRRREDELV
jgi:hypothetical protein